MSIKAMSKVWDLELKPGQKLVLLAIADSANDFMECYPSVGHLVKKCSMSERAVQDNLKDLEKSGLLVRDMRKGRSTIYRLNLDNQTPAESAPRRICTPQNLHPAESAPTPAESAPTPAESAPITITYPREEKELTNVSSKKTATKPKKPKISIDEWEGPSERCWALIDEAGIDREFANALVGEFRMYWEERGDKRPGWDATFLNHAKNKWERKPASNHAPIHNHQRGNYGSHSDPIKRKRSRDIERDEAMERWVNGEPEPASANGAQDLQGNVIDLPTKMASAVRY